MVLQIFWGMCHILLGCRVGVTNLMIIFDVDDPKTDPEA
jgi:hypothetical protein